MSWNCSIEDWGDCGKIWAHERGGEEAYIEVACVSYTGSGVATLKIMPSWGADIIHDFTRGEEFEVSGDTGYRWKVVCTNLSDSQRYVRVQICWEEVSTPPPTSCADYTTQDECEDAGCEWYDGACHGSAPPPTPTSCADYTTQDECEDAGCTWCEGKCTNTEGGDINMSLYGSVSVFGHDFVNTELRCDIAQSIIKCHGVKKALYVGGTGVLFAVGSLVLPGSIATTGVIFGGILVTLKSISDACDEATHNFTDAAYTEHDHDVSVQKVIDDLESSGITVGDDPDDDVTPAEVDAATRKAEDIVASSPEQQDRNEKLANGEITKEEWDKETTDAVYEVTIENLFKDKFTFELSKKYMLSGDIECTGLAPQKYIDIDIVVVKSWLGYDALGRDRVLTTVTSGGDRQYKATIRLEKLGSIELRARIKKELFGSAVLDLLKKDVVSPSKKVIVITPIIVALSLALGALLYDKHTHGRFIGVFKKR